MADYLPPAKHLDNERISENGASGRFILPSNPGQFLVPPTEPARNNSADSRYITGRGVIRNFTLRFGDTSQNDRAAYPNNLAYCPQRAMVGLEGLGNRKLSPTDMLRINTLINLLPSPTGQIISARGKVPWWEVLFQENVAPIKALGGIRWRSPIMSVGLATLDSIEHMTFEVRKEPAAPGDQGEVAYLAKIPVQRRQHNIEVDFVDGKNGPGYFKVTVEGKVVAEYDGLTGYVGFGSPYPAYGYYRAPNAEEVRTIRFEGFREQLIAA